MLDSVLVIEELLKCELCNLTLSETRTLPNCGHLFCLNCAESKLEEKNECPSCQLPAFSKDLQKSLMHDNLVAYVKKLKTALLPHSLTPWEQTLEKVVVEEEQQQQQPMTTSAAVKRVLAQDNIDTQESEENLEDEYNDLPDQKRFKPSPNEGMDIIDDILGIPMDRPVRNVKPPNYTAGTVLAEEDEDEEMAEASSEPPVLVGSPRTPEEVETTNEKWECPDCKYKNNAYLQACGICHIYRNRNIPAAAAAKIDTSSSSSKKSKLTRGGESSSKKTTLSTTLTDRSLETTATLPTTRRRSNTTALQLPKDIHIMYTSLTDTDEAMVQKSVDKVAESRLKMSIHEELKNFNELTHVITSVERNKCLRTLKYLHGLLLGKWIVNPKWLVNSMKEKKWLPEETYEVQGDAKSGITYAPSKGRERLENNQGKLFEGMRFHLYGEFSEAHNRKDISLLLKAGGGDILHKKPVGLGRKVRKGEVIDLSEPIVILSGSAKKKKDAWLDEQQVRDPVWLINCISNLKVE